MWLLLLDAASHLLNWKHSRWTELVGVPQHKKSSKYDLCGIYASLVHHPPATSSARSATGCVAHGPASCPQQVPPVIMRPSHRRLSPEKFGENCCFFCKLQLGHKQTKSATEKERNRPAWNTHLSRNFGQQQSPGRTWPPWWRYNNAFDEPQCWLIECRH